MGPRKALLKGLTRSLFLYEKIETTEAKAKELRPFAEKIITKGKTDTLHSRRIILAKIGDPLIVEKILKEISPKYKERNGGYSRIVKTGFRTGDNAKMAVIELL